MIKKKQKELFDKLNKEPYEIYEPKKYTCEHGSGMYPCSTCNRQYPMKMLVKRSKSPAIRK